MQPSMLEQFERVRKAQQQNQALATATNVIVKETKDDFTLLLQKEVARTRQHVEDVEGASREGCKTTLMFVHLHGLAACQ